MDELHDIYIFCESYIQMENTLYLIRVNAESRICVLVVGNRDVFELLKEMEDKRFSGRMNAQYIAVFSDSSLKTNSVLGKLRDIIGEFAHVRSIYKHHFSRIRGKVVYFSSRHFVPYTYYIIRKLLERNEVIFFHPRDYDEYLLSSLWWYSPSDLYHLLRAKIVFGCGLGYYKSPVGRMTYIPDRALGKVSKVISRTERASMVSAKELYEQFNIWDFSGLKVVFFDTAFGSEDTIDPESIRVDMEKVFAILKGFYRSEEVGIKLHPAERSRFDFTTNHGKIIPRHIMGEFIVTYERPVVLGFCSTVMFNANARMVVSLIDLVTFLLPSRRMIWKKYLLDRSKVVILFPKTWVEFTRILEDSKANVISKYM